MVTSITIEDIPDKTVEVLAFRAMRKGLSLEEYVLGELIAMADKPDIESWLAQFERRVQGGQTKLPPEDILAYRDQDRK